jgi:hypothetical protein
MLANVMKTARFAAMTVGEALTPALTKATEVVQRIATTSLKWIKDNKQLVVSVAKIAAIVTAAGAAITGIGLSIAGLAAR